MPRRTIELDNATIVLISDDDPVPLGGRTCAIASARLLDEITETPPRGKVDVTSSGPGLFPRIMEDGLIGLAGIPRDVFPNLDTQPYSVQMEVQALGYLPLEIPAVIPADPNFPTDFIPVILGDQSLHRQPIVTGGRVKHFDIISGEFIPSNGAAVSLAGIWRTLRDAKNNLVPDPVNMAALHPPLYAPRPTPGGGLQTRSLVHVIGEDKTLLTGAVSGSDRLSIDNWVNLTVGDLLAIDVADPGRIEYLRIQALEGGGNSASPAEVILELPMAYSHRRGSLVQRVNPGAPGANIPLTQAAIPRDSCLFLNNLAGLTSGDAVQVGNGGAPDEYHVIQLYTVITDAEGYYRLPPLSRVAQVQIRATFGVLTHTEIYSPDYTSTDNRLDFWLR